MLHSCYKILLPNMNTGMKAPEGMGIVVETADIQNYSTKTGSRWDWDQSKWFFTLLHMFKGSTYSTAHSKTERYLHDEEEEEDDEDADMRMEPCRCSTQAGWSRRFWDFGPGEIVKQGVDAFSGHQLPVGNNTLIKNDFSSSFLEKYWCVESIFTLD